MEGTFSVLFAMRSELEKVIVTVAGEDVPPGPLTRYVKLSLAGVPVVCV